jgi:NADPH:quinone reductase-like Zn-dependent oxidoreductase
LKTGGRLLLIVADLPKMLSAVFHSKTDNKKLFAEPAKENPEQLQYLRELSEAGKFKPVIDRSFPFERIVEAHARVDSRRKVGNVVVTVSETSAEANP